MNYIANESDIRDTIEDFMKLCGYIENEKPFATQKGDLSVKSCHELNGLMRYPETGAKATDRMHQYSSISLWFAVAAEVGFIARAEAKGGKTLYEITEKYADFKKLNLISQYMLIFYTWYCHVDPEVQYNERGIDSVLSGLIDPIFTQMTKNGSREWIESAKDNSSTFDRKNAPIQMMMQNYYKTAQNLRDLGLIVFEEGEKRVHYFNWPEIERLKPTDFGVSIAKACTQRKYALFNKYAESAYFYIDSDADDEIEQALEQEAFIDPFIEFFPNDSIDISAIDLIIFGNDGSDDDGRIFEFTVSLGIKCYRIIRCMPEHTFEDLHLAIQKAFEFDNDHLYSFYLDGKRHSRYSVNAPYLEEPPFADEVRLKDELLKNKQRILYLFDFGACWQFDIVVDVKNEPGIKLKNPEMIKSVGDSPEQYPDF